ncbi:MAG: aspartate ammonia-lyase [Spirochaetaceae bacterium]|jgi:aspartate ammonia-lyase|nr:aspartate ammonia-lyase [Spirochaetaceae bacterium]
MKMRTEHDFLGEREVSGDALYGIHTLRAAENFALDYRLVHPYLVRAIILVKKAAARTWEQLGVKPELSQAIVAACDDLLSGNGGTIREFVSGSNPFIVDALQGGAGTSTNMNVNEVVANTALRLLGKEAGDYTACSPLDDVNRGQSTNDVYPTALRIAAIELLRELSAECAALQESLQQKENEFAGIAKLGRTELMDAVPVTLGSEFGAWAQAVGRDRWRLYKMEERLRQVNIGGMAVGRGIPAGDAGASLFRRYRQRVIETLRDMCGIGLAAAEYPMDITQNCDVFVEVSGLLKALAVNVSKIAGDLRLMNSGPCGGLGEIRLAPVQAGSSIMPGKINPVIPEMAIQVAIKVESNDYAISAAAGRGDFELNAFGPLIADSLLGSLSLLCRALVLFRTRCIDTLTANASRCAALLEASTAFAFGYVPALGYECVSSLIARFGEDSAALRAALEQEAAQK